MANDNNTNDNNIDDIQKGVLHKKKFDIIVHDESPNSLTRDLGNKAHKSVNTKAYRKPVPRPRPVSQNVNNNVNNPVPENNRPIAQPNTQPNTTRVNNVTSNPTTPPQDLQYDMPQDFVETNTNYVEDEERKRQSEKQLKETLDNYDRLLKEQEERRIANYNEFENAYNNVGKHETYLESRAKREEAVENVEEVEQEQPQNVVEEQNNNNNNVSNGQIGYEVDKDKVEYEVNNNNENVNVNTDANAYTQQSGYEVNKVEETKPTAEEENKVEQPTETEENKEEVKEEESAYSLSAIQQKNMKRRKENIRLVVLLIILVTLAILCVVLFILRSRMIDEVKTLQLKIQQSIIVHLIHIQQRVIL